MDELTLQVLLDARERQRIAVNERLVRELYRIQSIHQFEQERDVVVRAMKIAVEADVDREQSEDA